MKLRFLEVTTSDGITEKYLEFWNGEYWEAVETVRVKGGAEYVDAKFDEERDGKN